LLRKCHTINPEMVSLVVTATDDMETFIDAIRKSGASRVISKPWDPDVLLKAVREALAKYERGLETQRTMSMLRQVSENLKQIRK
jgi:DNA-binding NtrC family response regulator